MSDLRLQNQEAWDRLFDLLYDCEETVTSAEADAELQQAGIDIRPGLRRLQEVIERKRAEAQLAGASARRTALLEKLRGVVSPKLENIREGVRDFIVKSFSGPEQAAHFHKLDAAATDSDLQSLMDDLSRLAELRQDKDKDGRKAE